MDIHKIKKEWELVKEMSKGDMDHVPVLSVYTIDWLITSVQYLTDELRTTENDVRTAYKALEYIEYLAEITDDKRLMTFVKQGRGEIL